MKNNGHFKETELSASWLDKAMIPGLDRNGILLTRINNHPPISGTRFVQGFL